jgi:hypothetical protein
VESARAGIVSPIAPASASKPEPERIQRERESDGESFALRTDSEGANEGDVKKRNHVSSLYS